MTSRAIIPIEYQARRYAHQMTETLYNLSLVNDGVPIFSECAKSGKWLLYQVDPSGLTRPVDTVLSKQNIAHLEAKLHLPVHKLSLRYPLPGLQPGRYVAVEMYPSPKLPSRVGLELSQNTDPLTIAIGQRGQDFVWKRLDKLGHTLVAGSTGMGKSSFVHACLANVLSHTPTQSLQVVMCDVKGAEFALWERAPHLYDKIAKTPADCGKVLMRVVGEILNRNTTFAQAGCRDIASYHEAGYIMPFIWVLVDEVIDLILRADKSDGVGDALKTIASTGRSSGVFLWMATQQATKDAGIPRVVTVNVSSRFCFRMGDGMASKAAGFKKAHTIPPIPGRMLVGLGDDVFMAQAPFVPIESIKAIAGQLSLAAPSPLSEQERELIKYAAEHLDGQFTVNKLFEAFRGKLSHHKIGKLAKLWEARGWLTEPQHATDSRRVTSALLELI